MKPLKIGIVAEDMANARMVMEALEVLGYVPCGPAANCTEALEMLDEHKPDLLLLGSLLTGSETGIHIALKTYEVCQLPIIFLAVKCNAEIMNSVIRTKAHAFMLVPFNKQDLFTAIETAFNNFTNTQNRSKDEKIALWHAQEFMFVKCGYAYHKIFFKDILYLESDGNYVTIQLQSHKKVLIRSTLTDFTDQSKQRIFLRVHRSYSVNINNIDNVLPSIITIKGYKIPVGKSYKETLYGTLGILK